MKRFFFPHKTLVILLTFFLCIACFAQEKRLSPPDSATGKIGNATVTIKYGSPAVKGRKIWGDLVPYNKVWRAGANEATTFSTDKTIKIEGQLLPAGQYGFFLIPGETKWIVIFNRISDQWGAYDYDKSADILRVEVTPKILTNLTERLAYKINSTGFSLQWEYLEIPVLVK